MRKLVILLLFIILFFSIRLFNSIRPIDSARIKNYSVEKAIKDSITNLPPTKINITHSDKVQMLTSVFNNAIGVKTGKEAMDV
jgi:hypothetical protein